MPVSSIRWSQLSRRPVWSKPSRAMAPSRSSRPSTQRFPGLPAGEVERLLQPANRHELVDLLTFHVVPGAVTASDLQGQILSVETVEGSEVLIDATDGVRVGNAQVIQADIRTSNGIIHVVDRVIISTS